jgi:hypothetical protein
MYKNLIIPIRSIKERHAKGTSYKECHAKRSREAVQLCVTVWWSVAEPAARINSKNGGPRRGPIWIHLRRPPFAVGPLRGPWLARHMDTAGSAIAPPLAAFGDFHLRLAVFVVCGIINYHLLIITY